MFQILLVDDDADVRKVVKKILEKSGYNVIAVDNGLSALSELNEHHFDLLLSDASMPQYSGFDLLKTVRSKPKHQDLVIAMLTGRRELEDIKRAVELGANDYIVKPVDPQVLVAKIQRLLEHKKENPALIQLPDRVEVDFEASLQCPMKMKSIGLSGFSATSKYPLQVGQDFYLNIEALNYELLPKVRIISNIPDPNNPQIFLLQGLFLEMDEQLKNEIRKCIQSYNAA